MRRFQVGMGGRVGGRGTYPVLPCLSRFTVRHASISKRSNGEGKEKRAFKLPAMLQSNF